MTDETFEQIRLAIQQLTLHQGMRLLNYTYNFFLYDNSPLSYELTATRYFFRQLPDDKKQQMINATTLIRFIYFQMKEKSTTAQDIVQQVTQ